MECGSVVGRRPPASDPSPPRGAGVSTSRRVQAATAAARSTDGCCGAAVPFGCERSPTSRSAARGLGSSRRSGAACARRPRMRRAGAGALTGQERRRVGRVTDQCDAVSTPSVHPDLADSVEVHFFGVDQGVDDIRCAPTVFSEGSSDHRGGGGPVAGVHRARVVVDGGQERACRCVIGESFDCDGPSGVGVHDPLAWLEVVGWQVPDGDEWPEVPDEVLLGTEDSIDATAARP